MTGEGPKYDREVDDANRQDTTLKDEMIKAVELRQQRVKHWQDFGERSIGQNLSMIGSLGWLVILPTLLGLGLGRFLDQAFNSGIFWSAAFIFLGVAFGSYLAWRHITGDKE